MHTVLADVVPCPTWTEVALRSGKRSDGPRALQDGGPHLEMLDHVQHARLPNRTAEQLQEKEQGEERVLRLLALSTVLILR